MFNKVGFNHLGFNKTDLSSLITISGNILSESSVSGINYKIIPLSVLLNSNSSTILYANKKININTNIEAYGSIGNEIQKRAELYSQVISVLSINCDIDRIINSLCYIHNFTGIDGKINKKININGNIFNYSDNSVLVNNKLGVNSSLRGYTDSTAFINIKTQLKDLYINSNSNIENNINRLTYDNSIISGLSTAYADVALLFSVEGDLISFSDVESVISKRLLVEKTIRTESYVDSKVTNNIKQTLNILGESNSDGYINVLSYINSNLEIFSYLLARAKVNDTKQAIELIGRFLEQENINNNIFITEELISGIMNNEIYLEAKCG